MIALFFPLLTKLAAGVALFLAALAAWKIHGFIERRALTAKAVEEAMQRMAAVDRETAAHITAARADVDAADDAELDRLLDANAAAARRLVVQGTARDRGRHEQ